jgi:hypothetical protein
MRFVFRTRPWTLAIPHDVGVKHFTVDIAGGNCRYEAVRCCIYAVLGIAASYFADDITEAKKLSTPCTEYSVNVLFDSTGLPVGL